MTTIEMIKSYVTDCIDQRSMGFSTDFGVGKMVSTHVFFNTGEMVVTIQQTKETKGFSLDSPSEIINWIFSKIK